MSYFLLNQLGSLHAEINSQHFSCLCWIMNSLRRYKCSQVCKWSMLNSCLFKLSFFQDTASDLRSESTVTSYTPLPRGSKDARNHKGSVIKTKKCDDILEWKVSKQTYSRLLIEAVQKRLFWCAELYKRLSCRPHLSCSFVCAMQSTVFLSRPWRCYFHVRSAVCLSTPHQGQIYFTKADLHLSSDVEESPVLCQNHAAWE